MQRGRRGQGSCRGVECAPALHTVRAEPASRKVCMSTPAQALPGRGRGGTWGGGAEGGVLLRNAERAGTNGSLQRLSGKGSRVLCRHVFTHLVPELHRLGPLHPASRYFVSTLPRVSRRTEPTRVPPLFSWGPTSLVGLLK